MRRFKPSPEMLVAPDFPAGDEGAPEYIVWELLRAQRCRLYWRRHVRAAMHALNVVVTESHREAVEPTAPFGKRFEPRTEGRSVLNVAVREQESVGRTWRRIAPVAVPRGARNTREVFIATNPDVWQKVSDVQPVKMLVECDDRRSVGVRDFIGDGGEIVGVWDELETACERVAVWTECAAAWRELFYEMYWEHACLNQDYLYDASTCPGMPGGWSLAIEGGANSPHRGSARVVNWHRFVELEPHLVQRWTLPGAVKRSRTTEYSRASMRGGEIVDEVLAVVPATTDKWQRPYFADEGDAEPFEGE